jgi:hypothetical protein
MGGMTQYINLYDPALRRESPIVSAGQLAVALVVVALAFAAWATLLGGQVRAMAREADSLEAQLSAQRAQLAEVGTALAQRKPDVALAAELAAAEATLAARREVVDVLDGGAIGNKTGFSAYLRAFSRQTMQGLWLTGFEISGGGTDMAIHGRTLEAGLLPRYIRQLNDEAAFRGRNFAALKMEAAEDKPSLPNSKAVKEASKDAKDSVADAARPALRYIAFNLASAKAVAPVAEAKP